MGLIERVLGLVFGGDANVLRETAEVFRENAEAGAQRGAAMQEQAMKQYGQEFALKREGWFDRFMDGVNRLPRPAMALGTLGLFVSAMVSPLWFSERMQGIALVPEPLWWLLGVIVSFYFGARHQLKSQEFQSSIAQTMAHAPKVAENIQTLRELRSDGVQVADTSTDVRLAATALQPSDNPALADWQRSRNTAT